jgi:cyclase
MLRRAVIGVAGAAALTGLVFGLRPVNSAVNQVDRVAPGVYFHEGDLTGSGHCNNGWIVFDDYVLVVDANFPSGAQVVIPKIRAITNRPIRFVFDTHHHGDHAYGNQEWVNVGAVPVANTGVIAEMKKYETGYYGGKPGRWEESRGRPDVAASKLKPPTLLFPKEMIFDDGKHRVELKYFGVAHTHGDGWAWLPKERILFSGDACVNGPYNYVGDGNIGDWIRTLERVQELEPLRVCPGHGPMGDGSLLEDQRQFFTELRRQGQALFARHKSPGEARAQVETIRAAMLKQPRIKKFVGDFLSAQLEKAYVEAGGMPFPPMTAARPQREDHASAHGLPLLPRPVAKVASRR